MMHNLNNGDDILITYMSNQYDASYYTEMKKQLIRDFLLGKRQNLASNGNIKQFSILKTIYGKPYVEWDKKSVELTPVYFSVSHSKDYWMMAVSSNPIGIDIEWAKARNYKEECSFFFHPKEQRYLEKRPWELSKIWSAKESYLKFLGIGILKETHFFSVVENDIFVDRIGSINLLNLNYFEEYYCFICGPVRSYTIVKID